MIDAFDICALVLLRALQPAPSLAGFTDSEVVRRRRSWTTRPTVARNAQADPPKQPFRPTEAPPRQPFETPPTSPTPPGAPRSPVQRPLEQPAERPSESQPAQPASPESKRKARRAAASSRRVQRWVPFSVSMGAA
jgi:hypothetical protein